VRAVRTFVAIGLEQIPAALGQDHGPVLRVERACPNQAFLFEVSHGQPRVLGVVAQVMEVALGYDAKRTDRAEHPGL
jgi:hypothetical protein